MTSMLEKICSDILKRVTPTEEEKKRIYELSNKLVNKVKEEAKEKGLIVEIRTEGSVAKGTWLVDHPEIDIFMQVPTTITREKLKSICLDIAKKATAGYVQVERFAEHPYLEVRIDDVWVNIVPCYNVQQGDWISSTDRTPFHTDFLKPLLDERLIGEIRLLKKFMKGIGVYGAEIKIGGFSGYLCELLVLNYGSFIKVLTAFTDWKKKVLIDYKKHYAKTKDIKEIFEEPLVFIDPIDKKRNVAAAVKKEKLDEFIAASREFLKNPNFKFFYPPEVIALKSPELIKKINARGSSIIFFLFKNIPTVPDVLWGQLYKSKKSLLKLIKKYDFSVMSHCIWSDEKNLSIFIFELQNRFLPNIKKHFGPPLTKKAECEKFIRKYLGNNSTVSGPRIEKGRWVVDVKRMYSDVMNLLSEKLDDGGRTIGMADLVAKAVADSKQIFVNEEIASIYSSNDEFAKYLTNYLEGKLIWLL